MGKKIVSLIVILLFVSIGYGSNVTRGAGTAAFAFLKITQGARASAMADCYTGLSDDVNAIYWNPAGISQLNSRELTASYSVWFEAINRFYIGYVHPPFKFGTFGVSINYLSVPGIEKRTGETDHTFESIFVWDMAMSLAYGKKITERISLGSSIKIINGNLNVKNIFGFGIDLGCMYKISDTFLAGLSLQNIGSGTKDPLPMLLRTGVSKKLLQEKMLLLSDIYLSVVDMTASLSIGGEYQLSKFFYPRIGYKYRITNTNLALWTGISAGFGLKFKKYQFDYAFMPYGDLGFTHRLDFLIRF